MPLRGKIVQRDDRHYDEMRTIYEEDTYSAFSLRGFFLAEAQRHATLRLTPPLLSSSIESQEAAPDTSYGNART